MVVLNREIGRLLIPPNHATKQKLLDSFVSWHCLGKSVTFEKLKANQYAFIFQAAKVFHYLI